MATRNTAGNRRIVSRTMDKDTKAYFTPRRQIDDNISSKIVSPKASRQSKVIRTSSRTKFSPTSQQTNVNVDTARSEATPVRRVVIVRNTRNPKLKGGPVDISDFGKPNTEKILPVISNGVS